MRVAQYTSHMFSKYEGHRIIVHVSSKYEATRIVICALFWAGGVGVQHAILKGLRLQCEIDSSIDPLLRRDSSSIALDPARVLFSSFFERKRHLLVVLHFCARQGAHRFVVATSSPPFQQRGRASTFERFSRNNLPTA